jgi:hypothetical protein
MHTTSQPGANSPAGDVCGGATSDDILTFARERLSYLEMRDVRADLEGRHLKLQIDENAQLKAALEAQMARADALEALRLQHGDAIIEVTRTSELEVQAITAARLHAEISQQKDESIAV